MRLQEIRVTHRERNIEIFVCDGTTSPAQPFPQPGRAGPPPHPLAALLCEKTGGAGETASTCRNTWHAFNEKPIYGHSLRGYRVAQSGVRRRGAQKQVVNPLLPKAGVVRAAPAGRQRSALRGFPLGTPRHCGLRNAARNGTTRNGRRAPSHAGHAGHAVALAVRGRGRPWQHVMQPAAPHCRPAVPARRPGRGPRKPRTVERITPPTRCSETPARKSTSEKNAGFSGSTEAKVGVKQKPNLFHTLVK